MSLIPPGTAPSFDITLYASVQVAVTCAALYDHALGLGREVELIWMKPPSLVTVLYVIARYLGDVVLIAGLCLCFSVSESEEECIRLFQFRAWGALAYSWATQATMQLRIYAMYGRSRRTLVMMVTSFLCEVAAIAFIIWRTIGPDSSLKAITNGVSGGHFCAFSGIHANFVYIFIPFLCFESFLFLLAARAFFKSTKRIWKAGICDEKILGVNTSSESFMCILARDSLCYFFVNLIACAVVMGLWQSVAVLYANMCIPFVMLLEVLVGTRLILDFRERYARQDDVLSARCSSLYFRDDIQLDIIYKPERCGVETIVVTDAIV
ncbi:hypothetical protein L210DRAFT_3556401 [Boletus edulis BED1]|uniref:DUF6533 domain-containing protein n=1 Tax=Boletus edulis BED1 TaxID=1328754 RepID=A0AAD4GBC0_BOLED|nr:hypothetical protein L210DRAFT_3556401 [Boletus edulis BED1]